MAEKLHGTKKVSNGGGQTIINSYGRDNSDYTGSKKMAREGSDGFKGGVNDVSHSLSGTSANQKAE